jgi:hypothetical protein
MIGLDSVTRWGVRWRQVGPNASEHIMYENRVPVIFYTRREAREWVNKRYGYIRGRKDLFSAPHFLRMPAPIRVKLVEVPGIEVREV